MTAKFEVGKTYCDSSNMEYECVFVHGFHGFLWHKTGGIPFPVHNECLQFRHWKEKPPKLTFGDLKLGEKFKWADTMCRQSTAMKIQALRHSEIGYLYLDCFTAWFGDFESWKNNPVVRVSE